MKNSWNQWIYRLYAPFYDVFFNRGLFLQARKDVFKEISFQKGERVLFVGVGTGADLELVPLEGIEITAVDYSEEMLARAKKKFPSGNIAFLQMDAQEFTFPEASFDYVIASLILSVVPDSEKAFAEMARVVRSGGQLIVFDKFAKEKTSIMTKALRPIIRMLGTDIGLSFERIYEPRAASLSLIEDRGVLFCGMYRKIHVRKD